MDEHERACYRSSSPPLGNKLILSVYSKMTNFIKSHNFKGFHLKPTWCVLHPSAHVRRSPHVNTSNTPTVYQCCQIFREKQASGPMKTIPKQATSLVMVEKKKEKSLHFALTHEYHPKSRNVLHYIIAFIIVYICYDPFFFSSRTNQYDIQYNRKRIEEEQAQKTCDPRLPIFISDFTEKQAQSRVWRADLAPILCAY